MFLHLSNIVTGLVKGMHLPLVENHSTNMELLKGLFKAGGVVRSVVLHHEELPEFLVEGHACNIQVRQLPIGHVFDQVVELINLGGIEQWLDKRPPGCRETVSRGGERSVSIPLEQK